MNDELKQAVELLVHALALLEPQVVVSSSDIARIKEIKTRLEKKVKKLDDRLSTDSK